MAITLANVMGGNLADADYSTIDEIRQASPYVLANLPFVNTISPIPGGSTLVASYSRISQLRPAHTRRENTEYPAFEGRRDEKIVRLIPMGAAYNIDRVFTNTGAGDEVAFQQGLAVRATVAKFHDELINGVASGFDTAVPSFDGLDKLITGTTTEWVDGSGDALDFSTLATQEQARAADRALRAWFRKMSGLRNGEGSVALLTNTDGATWLDNINSLLSQQTVRQDEFGRDIATFRSLPYVDLGLKPGSTTIDGYVNGTEGEEVIETDEDGVTTIYAVRFALDSVHGFSMATDYGLDNGGGLFKQWLPDFTKAGAVKRGEVELGPVAIAARSTLSVGAFRVRVR